MQTGREQDMKPAALKNGVRGTNQEKEIRLISAKRKRKVRKRKKEKRKREKGKKGKNYVGIL